MSLTSTFQKTHEAYYVATQMALAHNGIIRGLNSIYLQSTKLPQNDVTVARDFLTYCQCWSESMHHHHDAEEKEFFTSIEAISGVEGLMIQNVEQHRAFTPGFELFESYCRTCPPAEYDGQKLKSLVEGFAEPLTRHLYDEIDTLRALDKYDSARIRQAYQRLEKLLMATDNVGKMQRTAMVITANVYQATYSTSGLRNRRPELRRRNPRLPFGALFRTLCDTLRLRQAIPWSLALQSLHNMERPQRAGVLIVVFSRQVANG